MALNRTQEFQGFLNLAIDGFQVLEQLIPTRLQWLKDAGWLVRGTLHERTPVWVQGVGTNAYRHREAIGLSHRGAVGQSAGGY